MEGEQEGAHFTLWELVGESGEEISLGELQAGGRRSGGPRNPCQGPES